MNRPIAILVIAIAFGLPASPALSQTTVSGTISEDTTWTQEQSPYVLSGSVVVEDDAALTIEPGVSVLGDAGSALTVAGTLHAQGEQDAPIVFAAADEDDAQWFGIRFIPFDRSSYPYPTEGELRHAQITGADVGLDLDQRNPAIDSVVFERNGTAISLSNPPGLLEISQSRFTDNDLAIEGRTKGTVSITLNDFYNNGVNLNMRPQSPYDCDTDNGLWDVHENDILLGPSNKRSSWTDREGYTYRPFDVQTPEGSNTSSYAVSATQNWWGSTDANTIYPRVDDGRCCPGTARMQVRWDPPSTEANTDWEPQGETLLAYSDSFHYDTFRDSTINEPQHSDCITSPNLRRMTGTYYGGGGKNPITLALLRRTARGCSWWRPRAGAFVDGTCKKRIEFDPTYVERGGGYWSYEFPRRLRPGRYVAFCFAGGSEWSDPGRNQAAFRILPATP